MQALLRSTACKGNAIVQQRGHNEDRKAVHFTSPLLAFGILSSPPTANCPYPVPILMTYHLLGLIVPVMEHILAWSSLRMFLQVSQRSSQIDRQTLLSEPEPEPTPAVVPHPRHQPKVDYLMVLPMEILKMVFGYLDAATML